MEYSHLLDFADKCEDPYLRLVYACKYFFVVNVKPFIPEFHFLNSQIYAASWAISVYFAYQRTWKPFNPILGETYEMTNHNGITFIAEQVGSDMCVFP